MNSEHPRQGVLFHFKCLQGRSKRITPFPRSGKIDIIVVYKIDRLTRSLTDFAKLNDLLDRNKVSFVAVTQQFNTSTSMGRLTLNVLLSFAQFEREVAGERIRDKVAASKKKGMWGEFYGCGLIACLLSGLPDGWIGRVAAVACAPCARRLCAECCA